MKKPNNITLIVAAILFVLAVIVFVARGQSGPPSFPTNSIVPAHSSLTLDWTWPENINEYGPIPIADVATNFSFLVFTSPLLTNPEWKLKYTFPGKSIVPISNYWSANIWEDMSTSAFFQIIVTNILNQKTSTPFPDSTCMLLSTPMAKVNSLTKTK